MNPTPLSRRNDDLAVHAEGLAKSFGDTHALRGIDLSVPAGTVLGLLGPNGAGKTTTVRILTTLLRPDAGHATVLGFDVARQADEVRRSIGVAGQSATVDEILSGRQNLELVGRLYHLPSSVTRARASELLAQFSLEGAADKPVREYSGGMRRRLDLAAALVSQPGLLVLDEPTTGLDPRSRSELWDSLQALVKDGTTLLLTTQYLEEADRLADHIAVVDHGRIIAEGTASSLKRQVGGERVAVVATEASDLPRIAEVLTRTTGSEAQVDTESRQVTVAVTGLDVLARVATALAAEDVSVDDLGLHRPTLDDVFLELTGRPADDARDTTEATA